MASSQWCARFSTWSACLTVLAIVIGASGQAAAQSSTSALVSGAERTQLAVAAGRAPVAGASSVEAPPVMDGDVINDPVWAAAEPVSGFRQTTPDEGQPASQRTEVRVIYTADTLYFGVVCYDDDPSTIVVADSRRDSPLDETDSFQIILDTYLDQQNGFVFGTNPSGLEYDGQVTNEGQGSGRFGGGGFAGGGGRTQAGSGGGFNLNWDGSWNVQTRITDTGWTAEFAIPFRTLRYPTGTEQTWGMNFQRNIRRRNETAFWSQLPRQFNLYRLSLAGQVRGIHVPAQRNLKITPYILADLDRPDLPGDTTATGDVGVDLKYSVTPSVTLDATYNTDFAQVEVDDQQVNLNRFNLFFPEKRPFFLENAGLFAVGNSGQTELFFSRRIGIGPGGAKIPILAGGRLSGQVSGLNVGFLSMQTGEVGGLAPTNNFTVGRVRKDLRNRSNLGAIFVNRQASGSLAGSDDYNRTFGVDGRLGVGEDWTFVGFGARTETPTLSGDEYAYSVGSRYNTEAWQINFDYTEVGDNFNPEVGFLSRRGYRRINSFNFLTIRLDDNKYNLHEIRPHALYQSFWDFDGLQETGFLHTDVHWEWKNGYELHTGTDRNVEGLKDPFEISPGVIVPVGTYAHQRANIVFMTNQGAPFSFTFRSFIGGFFGGDRVALIPGVRFRVGETFNTSFSLSHNNIDLPGGSFDTNLAIWRMSYSFNPRAFIQALIQYSDAANIWSSNLRFGWIQQANTGLFVVYNNSRGLNDFRDAPVGRSLTLKFSRMFDVLDR